MVFYVFSTISERILFQYSIFLGGYSIFRQIMNTEPAFPHRVLRAAPKDAAHRQARNDEQGRGEWQKRKGISTVRGIMEQNRDSTSIFIIPCSIFIRVTMPAPLTIPIQLLQTLQHVPGYDEAAFLHAHEKRATTSYRVNPFKNNGGIAFSEQAVPVPWSQFGFLVEERPQFIFDPVFHAGGYYVQEASSMFLEKAIIQLTETGTPMIALDLCAAPGGKSTHLLSLLPENSVLVSNEVIRTRIAPLVENITRWGVHHSVITQNDPADFGRLTHVFDLVVADAPCSGSGLFRKDAAAAEEWSEANVQLCSQRQRRILADVWPTLKPGGIFIYATCSYSPEENEAICDWLMDQFQPTPLNLDTAPAWGITPVLTEKNATGYRFWPHLVNGEGFFMACFRKNGELHANNFRSDKKNRNAPFTTMNKNEMALLPEWVKQVTGDEYLMQGNHALAMPANLYRLLLETAPLLNIRLAGCTLGKTAGKDFIPEHSLALNLRAIQAPQKTELDLANALKFLKKETFEPGCSAKGWWLAYYKQYPLGWFKHLGNRVNNYYPPSSRILKALPV
jgi:16S rRNA C967 or C1407 C5-methylase (RsmB/RsmF family)/NOL1/NOP2/fmu family ribosome biogenesis protein